MFSYLKMWSTSMGQNSHFVIVLREVVLWETFQLLCQNEPMGGSGIVIWYWMDIIPGVYIGLWGVTCPRVVIEGGRLVVVPGRRGILKMYVNFTVHSNIHIYEMLESHNCDQRCQHQHAHAMFTKFGLAFFPCSHAPRSQAHWELVLVCHVNGPLIMSEEIQAHMTRNIYGLLPTNLTPLITTLGHVTTHKTYIHTWDYVY